MSIQVTLLTFNKRENSTLKPTAAQITGGSTLDCLLLDNTSLMNPTLRRICTGWCYRTDYSML